MFFKDKAELWVPGPLKVCVLIHTLYVFQNTESLRIATQPNICNIASTLHTTLELFMQGSLKIKDTLVQDVLRGCTSFFIESKNVISKTHHKGHP